MLLEKLFLANELLATDCFFFFFWQINIPINNVLTQIYWTRVTKIFNEILIRVQLSLFIKQYIRQKYIMK